MKTLNELYAEVMNSEELKNEFLTLKAPEDIGAFAAKHGCTTTLDEIKAFFEEKAQAAGELSEDDLAQVAGGKGSSQKETLYIPLSLIVGRAGTAIEGKGELCVWNDNVPKFDPLSNPFNNLQ